jgi:hypothetical protein
LATVNADALVYFSSTAPVNPASNPLWGDTSVTPYKLKRWNGTGWDIIATLNTGALADVDAADWSTQITGTGKPADNADVTANAISGNGVNIIPSKWSFWNGGSYSLTPSNGTLSVQTDAYFGENAIKLIASAPDMYVYLGDSNIDYNIPINPNKKWILSFFAKGSLSSMPGQVYVRTPFFHYNISFHTSTTSGTWKRFSGVIDLSSDDNTEFILRLDNDNGSGDIYFDGIMLEEQIGNLSEPSAYNCANSHYALMPEDGADVTQTALDFGAAIDNATANGATLISGGYIQTSLLDVDDIIVNGAILVTGDGTSNLTDDAGLGSTATWANVSGTGKPADNADVTAKHTANDTTYVNGTAASTVKNNAATGATHAGTAHAPSNADKTTATVIGNAMDGTAVITTGIIKDSAENMVIDFDAATIEINSTYGLLVNSSDGIKIDSGGSIVFLGRNDDPGSLVFTGSSGSTASGVDASGAFLCFWPSLAATNNGFAVGYRPTFDGNVSETSFDYISFSGAFSTTLIGNNKELRITGSGTESVGNIFPSTTNMYSLGSSYTVWAAIYGDAIYRNGSALDVYDDLYELSQIKSKKEKNEFGEKTEVEKVNAKGLPVIDPLSIPQELTNYDDVVATLKHDNCDLITQEDIDEYIQDDDEAGWMLKTDFTLLSDLTMGAVRQLDSEVISMFELLSNRITKLENTLGGTKNAN